MRTARTPDTQMRVLKDWAIERMTTGAQTPYAWFQCMKLIEVLDAFLEAGEDAGIHEPMAKPEPRKRPRPKRLPSNVVAFDAALRQRAAD